MASNLSDGFAIYPMVEEAEATGAVAGLYAQLLTRMPFVPSLFKSFAVCPPYLVLAYEQAAGVLDGHELTQAGQDLEASVRHVVQPPEQGAGPPGARHVRGPARPDAAAVPGLLLALDGELEAPPVPGEAPPARPVKPDEPPSSQWDAPAPALYGAIRAALDTPVINTIWRQLAGAGQLEQAWAVLGPQTAPSRPAADELQDRALEIARRLSWTVVADGVTLDGSGIRDGVPRMTAVLDAYVKTLPRVLVLASSSARQ
jgi:hypothetical protein